MVTRLDRFWSKVDKNGGVPVSSTHEMPNTECWVWKASRFKTGYGAFWDGKKVVTAHSYSMMIHQLPTGEETDHLCRNRVCVNPDHLEGVSRRENTARGLGKASWAIRENTCKHGHSLERCYINPTSGSRVCRTCMTRWQSDYKRRKAEKERG